MSININKIGSNTHAIYETLKDIRDEFKVQGKEMELLTKKIEENTRKVEAPKKDWKYVHQPSEAERFPLATTDVKKLLNVI